MSSETLHAAILWESLETGNVRCNLCNHRCTLAEGAWGICGVRTVQDGTLRTTVYGRVIAANADPIEKKPLFHVHPGSLSLSVATIGCNFRCRFCQNWSISQVRRRLTSGRYLSADELVRVAVDHGCRTIAFTYTEPTIFMEYALDGARLAQSRGVDTVFVTNGFMTPEAIDLMAPVVAAANVDLKAFRDETYRHMMGGRLQPVLESLRALRRVGVWVEVTTLVIPGLNDSAEELADIARFIAGELGPEVPWHVSRFHPDHELSDRGRTPMAALERAVAAGVDAGLRYVYAGNVPGHEAEHTRCHACGKILIHRRGFQVDSPDLEDGRCPNCATPLAGLGLSAG